jgi:hypothetical protein
MALGEAESQRLIAEKQRENVPRNNDRRRYKTEADCGGCHRPSLVGPTYRGESEAELQTSAR